MSSVIYDYLPEIRDALAGHGLDPLPHTPPQQLRDAVSDLYRYEIRSLRARLLAGQVERANYAAEVIELRKKYWLLSLPLHLWAAGTLG